MKSRVSKLIVIGSLSALSACGGGSGGTGAPPSNSPPPTANQWTWVSGSKIANHAGVYGSLGTAAPSNIPGTRSDAVGWIDAGGDLWFFGGNGYGSVGTDVLNDLWQYSAGEWSWMGGSNLPNESGVYGTQGVASSSNVPGARFTGASWTVRPEISGFSAVLALAKSRAQPRHLTTSGSTVLGSGRGSEGLICPINLV
jgi:hypothetical protein